MRRRLILTALSLLTALTAVGPLVPAGTHAAPTALTRPSSPVSITGTVVATPQPTPPTTLLVQVGGQTIAVMVSYGTLVTRGDNTTVALNQLNDGDTVQISGNSLANGAIDAFQVVDLSLPMVTPTPQPPLPLTLQGTLASVLSGPILCLVNASVTGNALQPRAQFVGPCSSGQQPVYVTGTTQYLLSDGSATSLGKLLGGDTLQVVGTLANGQFTASLIRDLSQSTPTPTPQPPVALKVIGILASEPNGTTLCLQLTGVSSNALSPNAQYCPAPSQLPVLLTGTTQYQLSDGTAASLGSLRIGETLLIAGVLANGQFTASQVTDLSQSTPPPPVALTLTGTLVSQQGGTLLCLLNTSVTGSALQPRAQIVGPCSSGQQPVYVNAATQYSLSDGTGAGLSSLHPTDNLQVTGLIANGQFTATQIKNLSQATPPPPVALTVQGNLASVVNGTTLCLQLTGVAGNALSPRALTASPLPIQPTARVPQWQYAVPTERRHRGKPCQPAARGCAAGLRHYHKQPAHRRADQGSLAIVPVRVSSACDVDRSGYPVRGTGSVCHAAAAVPAQRQCAQERLPAVDIADQHLPCRPVPRDHQRRYHVRAPLWQPLRPG